MEKSRSIKQSELTKGYYIELECCMCLHTATYAASTKKDLQKILDEEGWRHLDSDMHEIIGHHCGCDYK